MDKSRLKSLRMKQIVFFNACICFLIPLTGSLILSLEPSPSEMYLVAVLLYGVMLLGELLSFFFPKRLLFLRGFRFLQEIAEYERKKIGKQQTRNERIGRLCVYTLSLIVHIAVLNLIKNNEPMQIRDVTGFWTIMAVMVIVFALIGNVGILNRIHKVDKAKPGQFRWFTLKSLALGVILGVVAVALVNAGFEIALN